MEDILEIINIRRHFPDFSKNFLERRNEFWSTYGQITLAIFLATLIAILLLTKTISADAGLPILSAISGFAIAKNISVGGASIREPSESSDSNDKKHPPDGGHFDLGGKNDVVEFIRLINSIMKQEEQKPSENTSNIQTQDEVDLDARTTSLEQ
jgi:hypothetical protein